MRCLTLTQPWATLIAIGAKKIETRSWSTSYRGPLAIHAAKGLASVGGDKGLYALWETEPFYSVFHDWNAAQSDGPFHSIDVLHRQRGKIIATCELHDCVPMTSAMRIGWWREYAGGKRWDLTEQEYDFGLYAPGRYAWLLSNIQALSEPIPARGYQRLWEPDTLTQMAITRQQIQAVQI